MAITAFDRPHHFRDEMVRGIFRRLVHDHYFEVLPTGTRMVDVFDFTAPLGFLGTLAERLFRSAYMSRFLRSRAHALKRLAESDAASYSRETELWLKIHKKDSGVPTVTCAQALDVALCWGWIDGIRKAFDERSFLQRFTPRRARSVWSQINRDHVARLTAARVHRGEPEGAQDIPHPRTPESLRVGVSHEQHEDARRARDKDRGTGRDAGAR